MEIKPKKRIKVQSAKAKGRNLQKFMCKKISELTGHEWGADCPISSRPMGQSGTDVRLESHVQKLFPYSVECKAQESWSVMAWIEQAKKNQKKDTDWLLVCKRKNLSPVIVIDADKFFELLAQLSTYESMELENKIDRNQS